MDEKVTINLLVEIAALEQELAGAESTLVHHTKRSRDLLELQAEYEEDAAEARRGGQTAQTRLKGKENEIRAADAALALKREQIVGCRCSVQYQAFQCEVAGLERKISGLEDEAFALLAAVEQAADERREAERGEVRHLGQGEMTELEREARLAQAARDELVLELASRIKLLPEAVRRHVLRLRKNGDQAVATVAEGACTGCYGQLPAQLGLDAERGRGLVRCASCARYIVHRPWR